MRRSLLAACGLFILSGALMAFAGHVPQGAALASVGALCGVIVITTRE